MTEDSGYVLRIERTFEASAEEVFDAWTSPEVMRRWFHAFPDWDTPDAEVDLREGGRIRVVMINSRISTDGRRDAQDMGWYGCFNELQRVLAG